MADRSDTPLRIALIGDFSGRANRNLRTPPKPIQIDPENFEDVIDRLGVALDFPGAASIRFRELDDFHPDQLYANLPLFNAIREAKKELADPRNFQASRAKPAADPQPVPQPPPASSGSLLEQIAAGSTAPAAAVKRVATGNEAALDEAIRNIGARHATPSADPRHEQMLATVQSVAAAQMRLILHHPDFQALEAAWRSVFFLFQQLETGVDLQIHLIDLSRDELSSDGLLERLFAEGALGDQRWSLLVGLYTFSPGERDCALLARLGSIARKSGAPFLAAIDMRLFGCQSIKETPDPDDWKQPLPAEDARAWQQLRQSADARWLGLVTPRFLLRLPYGKATSPIDSFAFEEMPSAPAHDEYLWGNPAVACACLLAQSRTSGPANRITGMPVHVYAPGDSMPQAEIWMTERFAAQMIDEGIMPLASVKHSDAIQLVRFQSIADPTQSLPGTW